MPSSRSLGAPLMADRQDRDHDKNRHREAGDDSAALLQQEDYYADDADGGEAGVRGLDLADLPKPGQSASQVGVFVWLLTVAACISGLLFGYDTGVISAALVSIDTSLSDRELTSFDKSIITSSTALFALIVSPFSSIVADALGRRRVLILADFLFIFGALLQSAAHTVTSMVVGRAVIGAAVGAASFVVPLYLAELAPASHRGRVVTMNVLSITLGQVVAYVAGWALSVWGDRASAWRYMVGLGALPAVLQLMVVMYMPETPRWLVMVGRSAMAKRVVAQVAGGSGSAGGAAAAAAVVREIEEEIRDEREVMRREGSPRLEWWGGWRELVTVKRNRRALIIACLLQGLQQLCGFNSLMYYSATIFSLVGFRTPTMTAMTVAVTNFLFTVVALFLIDRIGRRRILLYSLPFMIGGLVLSAYGFSFINLGAETSPTATGDSVVVGPTPGPGLRSEPDAGEGGQGGGAEGTEGAAVIILVSIMVYVASYALGLGNVPWMQSELFPLAVRSIGSGVATATNWGANFVVGLTFLPLMDLLSPTWTFMLYAVICVVGYLLVWQIYPETAGLSLEEATTLLENGWGFER
ncbi:hypothetical protein ACRALDRAFT_1074265 [Sodiomyces alcalophilus JCM 7366]|uniref:uncharacterized protein n=1 Tax=Sodiomyces alcalophilus JCM 7366 TaxID=591952 RepID=UPI0039B65622